MKVRINIDDTFNRWKKGEIGTVLENTYPEKYDYLVEIADKRYPSGYKQFFFYQDEVEILL